MRTFNYALAFVAMVALSHTTKMSAQVPGPVDPVTDPTNGTPSPWKDLIPASPNAAALGEYGKVPVGMFTGTVEQNIPLYTITTSNYSLPLSLNYRSNGTRVTDLGSVTGLGWVLNAGGVITRTLNDEPDEYGSQPVSVPAVPFDSQAMSDFLKGATTVTTQDGEHDVFAFNFGNYSGKFYLSGTAPAMQAVLVEPSPLKIELLPDFYSENLGTSQIRITDPQGIVYLFGGPNAVENGFSKTYNSGNTAESTKSKTVKNVWHLYKIILLNAEEITFTYDIAGDTNVGGVQYVYEGGISQSIYSKVSSINGADQAAHTYPMITLITSTVFKLTKIDWKTGSVTFSYSKRFTGGITDMEKLDEMDIFSKTGTTATLINKFSFDYLVATANPAYNNPYNINGSFLENSQRLFLTAIREVSPNDTKLRQHSFEYYNTTELPNRFSYAQDYWGYFNGAFNQDLVPKDLSTYNPDYYQASAYFTRDKVEQAYANVGGSRGPDAQYAVKGMLKKITYPTGGYSNLEYEAHTAGNISLMAPNQSKITVDLGNFPGGTVTSYTTQPVLFDQDNVRLIPLIEGCPHEANNNVSMDLYINEVPSGAAVPVKISANNQVQLTPITIQLANTASYYVDLKKGKSYTIKILAHTTCVNYKTFLSFSYYNTGGSIGGVRVSKITTGDLTGNEEIKRFYYGTDFNCLTCSSGTARKFEPGIDYYETSISGVAVLKINLTANPLHDLYDQQGYHITYSTVTEGYGNNFEGGATVHNFNTVSEIQPIHYRDPVLGTPFTNVFGNGEELKTTYYKKNGTAFTKVKEQVNTYTTDTRLASSIGGFRATIRSYTSTNLAYTYNLSTYVINSQWRYLSSASETTYDQNGANTSTTTSNYTYANSLHLQPTSITKIILNAGSSAQRSLSTSFQYPQDYTFPGSVSGTADVLKTMITKNIITIPIEQKTTSTTGSTTSLTGASLTTYKMNGSFVVKDKDYRLKSSNNGINQDVVAFTNSSINASGLFVNDPHYEQLISYNRYDGGNNLQEVAERKGTTSFIREPSSGNVWASVINSSYKDIAYSSFEHGPSSSTTFTNWNYNIAYVISATFLNGKEGYNLTSGLITSLLPLSTTQKYKVSFWRKVGGSQVLNIKAGNTVLTPVLGFQRNGWQYIEATFTGVTSLQIMGSGIIDELRLYPVNSRMSTYVYKDGVGVTSNCNENNQHTFYEYDEFNRLKLIKDQDGNILKKNEYQYQYIQN